MFLDHSVSCRNNIVIELEGNRSDSIIYFLTDENVHQFSDYKNIYIEGAGIKTGVKMNGKLVYQNMIQPNSDSIFIICQISNNNLPHGGIYSSEKKLIGVVYCCDFLLNKYLSSISDTTFFDPKFNIDEYQMLFLLQCCTNSNCSGRSSYSSNNWSDSRFVIDHDLFNVKRNFVLKFHNFSGYVSFDAIIYIK
jgi:hypothetical protein